ncbi:MAG: hypothetical protein HC906_05300 [Bacteroidales bacterium]|nr:hypothetical protein [Bacteroidales bacterium]
MFQKGYYDAAIDKSIKKIIKGKNIQENAIYMDKAYSLANQQDLERIEFLMKEGNERSWEEVYSIYSRLKYRQDRVKRVVPIRLNNKTIDYKFTDYETKMAEAKRNAADYFYNHGKSLMQNNDKQSFRQAYYELQKAKNFRGSAYPDIENLITESHEMGMSRILISAFNISEIDLPRSFMDNLQSFNVNRLDDEWREFHLGQIERGINFDYYIDIRIKHIEVSRGLLTEKEETIKKKG